MVQCFSTGANSTTLRPLLSEIPAHTNLPSLNHTWFDDRHTKATGSESDTNTCNIREGNEKPVGPGVGADTETDFSLDRHDASPSIRKFSLWILPAFPSHPPNAAKDFLSTSLAYAITFLYQLVRPPRTHKLSSLLWQI